MNAHARGVEVGADAIQVFNQSPRMWRPTRWKDDDVAAFRELMDDGPIGAVVIHAVYLINCASKDPAIREKSLASLIHSLQMGEDIDAVGVVLHPGSTVGEPHDEALARVADVLGRALEDTGSCPLLLEDTAGAGNTLGRTLRGAGAADRRRRRPSPAGPVPGLLPPAGQRLRRAHGRRVDRGRGPLRRDRGPGPAALPARERLAGAARVQPRPPRAARQRRARRPRHRGVPVRAALRGPARAVRGTGRGGQGDRARRHEASARAAPQRAPRAEAARAAS